MAERKIDVLVVRWYEWTARSPAVVPRWLAAARAHLPEAVPRRFGDHEPLPYRFGADADLLRAYEQADSLLFLAGAPPVFHATLDPGRLGGRGRVGVHAMHAGLTPDDERVRRFALALTHPGMLYVSASVEGGSTLEDDTLYGPGERPAEPYLAPRGRWLGLPPAAPLWCWFGPAYERLVRRHVTGEPSGGGLLRTGGPWVPPALRARLDEPDPVRKHAVRRPRPPFWPPRTPG